MSEKYPFNLQAVNYEEGQAVKAAVDELLARRPDLDFRRAFELFVTAQVASDHIEAAKSWWRMCATLAREDGT